jgi:molybdopterin-guanine dinucleotide biosynthesis protein A
MGTDKSRLELEGQTFVERIANELSEVSQTIKVIGREPQDVAFDLPSAPDVFEKWGALGGVHAALSACRAEWAAIIACDLPYVTGKLLKRLASFTGSFDAVAPIQRDEIPQPLCALYRITPCLRRAEQLIESGEPRPIALLQSVRTRWVSFAELADLDGADRFFDNINTPEDYDRISGKGKTSLGLRMKQ